MNTSRAALATIGLCVMLVSTAATPAHAEIIRVVSPASAENVEGDTNFRPRLVSHRVQFLFPASDFAGLPESHRIITAFNFRADRTQTQPGTLNFGDERIWMSTTILSSLTNVFDDNHGSDKMLVHDGPMSFPLLAAGSGLRPTDFADGVPLQTPFYYDPSRGNLLVERVVLANSPSGSVGAVDLQLTPDVRRIVIDNPAGTVGVVSNAVPVMEFQFVPEPTTMTLAGATFLSLVVGRWNGRQRLYTLSPASQPVLKAAWKL